MAGVSVRLTPRHEIAKQGLAFVIVERLPASARLIQERVKITFKPLLRLIVCLYQPLQHILRNAKASPASDGRREIHVAPFWMIRRALQLFPILEQTLDEALHAPLAIFLVPPIVDRKHRRNRDCVDLLSRREQRRVFLAREFAQRVVIGKLFRERDRDKMQA